MKRASKVLIGIGTGFVATFGLVVSIGYFGTKQNNFDFVISDYSVSSLNYKSGSKQIEKKTVNSQDTLLRPVLYDEYEEMAGATYERDIYDAAYPSTQVTGWESYALGGATSVEVTSTNLEGTIHDSLTFTLNENAHWSNGETVLASDYAFGIYMSISEKYSPHNSSLITDYSGLNSAFDLEINGGTVKADDFVSNASTSSENANTGLIYDDLNSTLVFVFDEETNIPTYFPSLLYQSAFWPVNYSWYLEEGLDEEPWKFGSSTEYYLSSGPYKIDEFDRGFGITFSKNQYYEYSEFVTSEKWFYKFNDSTLNQANWFASDELDYALIKEDGEDLVRSSKNSDFLYQTMLQPENSFLTFNLNENNTSPNAKYLQSTNFRKAIMHYYDREEYLKFGGFANTLPSSNMSDMYHDDASDFTNKLATIKVDEVSGNDIYLGQYTTAERSNALINGADSVNGSEDKWSSDLLGDYYWNRFLNEFGFTSQSVPQIELRYVTQSSSSIDPVYGPLKQVSQKTNGVVTFRKVGTATNFSSIYYYDGQDQRYDLAQFNDVPPFESPLANFTKLSNQDEDHGDNYVGSWTLKEGYDATINEASSNSHIDSQIISQLNLLQTQFNELFADGANFVNKFNSYDVATQEKLLISFEAIFYYQAPMMNLRGRASIMAGSKLANISLPTIGFPRFEYSQSIDNLNSDLWIQILRGEYE